MVKKFSIPCSFGGATSQFSIYIGNPEPKHHPIHFQSAWLGKVRGGSIPGEIMEKLKNLHELSIKNNASFEDLCMYALSPDDIKRDKASLEDDMKNEAPVPK